MAYLQKNAREMEKCNDAVRMYNQAITYLKQGSDDPGLIPTALLVGKGLEFRGDRFKKPLLVFHGFNRV